MGEDAPAALSAKEYDEQWSRLGDFLRYNPGARHRRRLVLRAIRAQGASTDSVLDVGCGLGETVEFLAAALPGCRFTGVDLSPLAVARCRGRLPQHAWAVCDIEAGALDKTFDLVVCSEVLEHLDHPASAVKNLAEMVRPGGVLVATIPHGKVFPTERAFGHVAHPTVKVLESWMQTADLRVERLQRWGWPAYAALKRAANVSPQTTMHHFGSGGYSGPVKAMNHALYALCRIGSLPDSRFGVQTIVTARRRAT